MIDRQVCESCAISFHLRLKGLASLKGPEGLIEDIESELGRLPPKDIPEGLRESMQEQKNPKNWWTLREKLKPYIIAFWGKNGASQGYIELGELLHYLSENPQFQRYGVNTIDARIREMANERYENPPFLLHWKPGAKTGRYMLNAKALEQEIAK